MRDFTCLLPPGSLLRAWPGGEADFSATTVFLQPPKEMVDDIFRKSQPFFFAILQKMVDL